MAKDRPYYRFMVRYGSVDQIKKAIDEQPDESRKYSLVVTALQRKDLPSEVVDHFFNNAGLSRGIMRDAAQHRNLSKDLHEKALVHSDQYVRMAALRNPSITREQLEHHAANNSDELIRKNAASMLTQKRMSSNV